MGRHKYHTQSRIKKVVLNQPLVTGIIIFFNGEAFIAEAIESVLAQSYGHWELLLVDDGSGDNTTAIALDYVQKYPKKIRYLAHEGRENLGMSAARNLGIRHSRGEYIAFLDQDDVWMPEKLAEQLEILQTYPEAAMVYGRNLYWYGWTGKEEDKQRDCFIDLGVPENSLVMPPVLLPKLWAHKAQFPGTSNAMVRRGVFESIGSYENSFRSCDEDAVFFTKVELNAPVFVAGNFWSKYRQHNGSTVALLLAQTKDLRKIHLPFFSWAEQYLLEQGQKDSALWPVFQKIRWYYCPDDFTDPDAGLCFFWRQLLNQVMSLGRKLLPRSARHYLWLVLGRRLYDQGMDFKAPVVPEGVKHK